MKSTVRFLAAVVRRSTCESAEKGCWTEESDSGPQRLQMFSGSKGCLRVLLDALRNAIGRDSNHRPLPCQSVTIRLYKNLQDHGGCQNTRKSCETPLSWACKKPAPNRCNLSSE
jgi:hypothetical protein